MHGPEPHIIRMSCISRSRSVGRLSAGRGAAALRAELLVARHGAHLDEAAVQALHLFALALKSQLVRFNEMIEGILQWVNTVQWKKSLHKLP